MKLLLVAAAALIDPDGRVLLAKRPEGKSLAGLWEFPGGKVETGERPEQALIRELKEELAIDVETSCLAPLTFASHAYTDFHLLWALASLDFATRKFPQARERFSFRSLCQQNAAIRIDESDGGDEKQFHGNLTAV